MWHYQVCTTYYLTMQQQRVKVETNVGKTALVGRRRNGQYVNASAEASTRLGQRTLSFQRGRGLLGDGRGPVAPQNACTTTEYQRTIQVPGPPKTRVSLGLCS